jgi:hypothetical protein
MSTSQRWAFRGLVRLYSSVSAERSTALRSGLSLYAARLTLELLEIDEAINAINVGVL